MKRTDERGFTLIELIAACALVVVLLVVALFLLRPEDYTIVERDAKRRTAIASMVQAINEYRKDNGDVPPDIPSKVTAISSQSGHYDLCKYLVPKYMNDIPLDPMVGVKANPDGLSTGDKCNTEGLIYAAGYAIHKDKNGQVIISSPIADNGTIQIAVPKK